mmetsp:Transcript_466/g.982  ORF Transcript_466/g.982 Transcript_466/m.982 type:complete len:245 (-) Transcript_466:205-939(-)
MMRIEGYDTSLIRLGNIGKHNVYHSDQHAVFERVTGILHNRNDVCAQLSNSQQVASGTVRKFYGVYGSFLTNNVGNMRDRGSSGSTNVKNFRAWFDPKIINTAQNCCSNLGSEGIPNTVFCFHSGTTGFCGWCLHTDSLFSVYGNTRGRIKCDQGILLPTSYENTLVAMRFDNNLSATLHSSSASSSTTTSASSATATSTTATASSAATASASSSETAATASTSASTSETATSAASASSIASST